MVFELGSSALKGSLRNERRISSSYRRKVEQHPSCSVGDLSGEPLDNGADCPP